MKKRVLSIVLALAVMLVSLPMFSFGFVSAEENNDITITTPTAPILEVDRVINNFDNISTDSTATVGNYTLGTGVGKNTAYKTEGDYAAYSYNGKTDVVIENGELKATLTSNDKFVVAMNISPVSLTKGNTFPSSNTVALQFHIDLTGITSVAAGTAVSFEPKLYLSTGRSSGTWGYCIPDETYIYVPDATEANPNPVPQIHTTGGGVQVYHGSVNGYAGQSGTIIVPFDAYTTESLSQFSGGTTIWNLYKYTDEYRHRSFVLIDGYAKKFTTGEYIKLDDVQWMKKTVAEEGYDNTIVAEDFNGTPTLGGWGNGNAWASGTNYYVEDGKLVLKKTCEGEGRALTTFYIPSWNEEYEAFAFDFDASNMVNDELLAANENTYIRMTYAVNKTDTTAYASCTFSGAAKFIWEDGTVVDASVSGSGTDIPHNFKGQILVPAESIKLSDAVKEGIAAGGQSLFYVEFMGLRAIQKDTVAYVDNFVYYQNDEELGDGVGTDFSKLEKPFWETKAPVAEDVKTIEASFKTESNFTQSIIATKFGDVSYHANMINVRLTSTGQLALYVGNARVDVTTYALNDGEWHHVAVTVDDANNRIVAYVDGKAAAVKELTADHTFGKNVDYLPVTIGNFLPAESRYHTVFDGTIANVRMWSDVRTLDELKANTITSVGADAEGLIAEWTLSGENFAKETTGKYDLASFYWNLDSANALYNEYLRASENGEFTIIYVPDTQTIVKNFKGQENSLFDWIIANAEKLNVKAVVALGDIVEYATDEDAWQRMSAQWNRLTEAGIPWVPTIGDHDYEDLYTDTCANYDKYFTKEMLYQNEWFKLGGTKDEDSIVNAYYTADISRDVKLLIMNLEVLPLDSTLEWASQVIEAHPDYRVIVATHRNMNRAYCQRYTEISYNRGNAGEDVWQKLISQHKNIIAYMCGHSETSGYYANYDTGVNGNKVLQVNCDLQNTDQSYKTLQAVLVSRYNANATEVQMGVVGTRPNFVINTTDWDKEWTLSNPADILERPTASQYYDGPDFKILASKDANSFPSTAGGYVNATTAPGAGVNAAYYGYKSGNITYTWDEATESGKYVATANCNANGHLYIVAKTRPNADTNMISFHMDATGVQSANGTFKGQLVFAFNKATGHTVKAGSYIYFQEDGSNVIESIWIPKSTSKDSSWNHYIDFKAGVSGTYYIPTERFGPTTAAQSGYGITYEGTNWINVEELSTTAKVANWRFNTDGSNYKYNFLQLRNVTLTSGDVIYLDDLQYNKVVSYGEEYEAVFKDASGDVLGTTTVLEGTTVKASDIPAAPERMGYTFTGWSADVELPIYDNTVFTALYEKDTTTEYEVATNPESEVKVEVTLPAGQEKPYYNDRITLSAPATNEAGQKFAYWTINGSKFSYASTISFLVFDELDITPVYADEVEENPIVIYTNTAINYVLNGTKWNMQVMGVVDAGEAEVTEVGILLSASEMTAEELKAGYEANNGTVYKMTASAASNGRQFLYTVKNIALDRTRCATVYAIINGELVVGEAAVCMTIDANGAVVE